MSTNVIPDVCSHMPNLNRVEIPYGDFVDAQHECIRVFDGRRHDGPPADEDRDRYPRGCMARQFYVRSYSVRSYGQYIDIADVIRNPK